MQLLTRRRVLVALGAVALLGAVAWAGARWTAARTTWSTDFAAIADIDADSWTISGSGVDVLIEERLTHFAGGHDSLQVRLSEDPWPNGGVARVSASGEVAVAGYAKGNTNFHELQVTRFTRDGRLLFKVPLGLEKNPTCGTGYRDPVLAVDDEHTWVTIESGILELDASGKALGWLSCNSGPRCVVVAAHAHAGAVVLETFDSDRDFSNPRYSLEWYGRGGTFERRALLTRDGLGRTFDGRGGYYWVTRKAPIECPGLPNDDAPRLVRADARGCTFGPRLPADVARGEAQPLLATGPSFVFAVERENPPIWKRWLRGDRSNLPYLRLHRFRLDGTYVDSRFARADSRSSEFEFLGAIDDEHLVLTTNERATLGGYWHVSGLEY